MAEYGRNAPSDLREAGGDIVSEARVIQIRPLANTGAPIWDYMSSDYPDRIKMPMEDGHVITYVREIEQPHPKCLKAVDIIRTMQGCTFGGRKK